MKYVMNGGVLHYHFKILLEFFYLSQTYSCLLKLYALLITIAHLKY
jgi:hypothetical protein